MPNIVKFFYSTPQRTPPQIEAKRFFRCGTLFVLLDFAITRVEAEGADASEVVWEMRDRAQEARITPRSIRLGHMWTK